MEPIELHLREDAGLDRIREPIQVGIPIPEGVLLSAHLLTVAGTENHSIPVWQATPLAHWPDGSIRWLKLNFQVNLAARQATTLTLGVTETGHGPGMAPLQTELEHGAWHISTGNISFRIPQHELSWTALFASGSKAAHEIHLTDQAGNHCFAKPDADGWQLEENGPACTGLAIRGQWQAENGSLLARFTCNLRFFTNNETAELDLSIHNPNRARHPGGLWDLGDPGSIAFRELSLRVRMPEGTTAWLVPETGQKKMTVSAVEGLELYQDSSGGINWQSRNHINARGEIITRFQGYRLHAGDQLLQTGKRASPIVGLTGARDAVQAGVRQFWQNFPSAMTVANSGIIIGLFPAGSEEPYELQGGEQKTQTVYLNYSNNAKALLWTQAPLVPSLAAKHYQQASAFPWFQAGAPEGPLDDLIRAGVAGSNNFFAKREIIDEYGWRHFGDLFADHETLYQKQTEPRYISHYNNQYDAIYGFARQFALTGDQRWWALMDDLARHVADIDIYHTEDDRTEYNNGLFWHTDHYLDAGTATHRTFTRLNTTSSTPGQTGGGPAAEHCYTTGFLYHYWLTGHAPSRTAVLQLASWMSAVHEGRGGLMEQLLAFKKNELPQLKALITGNRPSPHKYPFTRGTGNYLTALLDAHYLEPEGNWMNQAEDVIRDTIHPADNIEARNLLKVETGWSYLILLASLVRYLVIKSEYRNYDHHFYYARDCFIHYALWMADHEKPFLEHREQLEFANDTWVAQDIRKVMLMYQAAMTDPANADKYLKPAERWLDDICSRLASSPERDYTRILVILMQNNGPQHRQAPSTFLPPGNTSTNLRGPCATPSLTWSELFARIAFRIKRGLRSFNFKQEKKWLETRLNKS